MELAPPIGLLNTFTDPDSYVVERINRIFSTPRMRSGNTSLTSIITGPLTARISPNLPPIDQSPKKNLKR